MQAFVDKWQGTEFQSSTGLTEEFAAFARDFKKALGHELQDDFEVTFHRRHFEVGGFLRNRATQRLVYWHVSDVRFFFEEWIDHVLIRTATDERDFSGGPNHYTTLVGLRSAALRLTAE